MVTKIVQKHKADSFEELVKLVEAYPKQETYPQSWEYIEAKDNKPAFLRVTISVWPDEVMFSLKRPSPADCFAWMKMVQEKTHPTKQTEGYEVVYDFECKDIPVQKFICLCGLEVKLYYNGGELDSTDCSCGVTWRSYSPQIRIQGIRPDRRPT